MATRQPAATAATAAAAGPPPPSTPAARRARARAPACNPEDVPRLAAELLRGLRREYPELLGNRINQKEAKEIFSLNAKELEPLDFIKVDNPISPLYKKQHMYKVQHLAEACILKHGSLVGLKQKKSKNKAAAVKRKETREYGPQSKDPRVKEIIQARGLERVKRINKTWANNLLRLTNKDLEGMDMVEEANPGSDSYRSQHMYEVRKLVEKCVEKYGSLQGLGALKPTKTSKTWYEPYEKPKYEQPDFNNDYDFNNNGAYHDVDDYDENDWW